MTALDTIEAIYSNENLSKANFLKYCYVTKDKVPFCWNGTESAHPNILTDFVPLEQFQLEKGPDFAGIGISVQASGICAIDVDHCFKTPFDLSSGDSRAQDIINIFGGTTYIEFSFSGTGMRILFKAAPIQDYIKTYYIKNSKTQCEYYYPQGSNRYVTVTARTIICSDINFVPESLLKVFLDTYMLRPIKRYTEPKNEVVVDNVDNKILHFLRTNKAFQDNWFDKAPGSGSNESERDFFLLKFIYENISANKEQMKEIFEKSPFFESKDRKHKYKWERAENRYFNYLYNVISGGE